MSFPQTSHEGWAVFPDEQEQLALHQDCLEDMEATIQRLRAIVASTSLPEIERQALLYQLSHILLHLRESVNHLLADQLRRRN